jgi:hypothetical protein
MKASILLLAALVLSIGCSSGDSASTATPDTTAPATQTASAEKAKCAGCGKEVAKAELVSHDGKMMCQACIAAHNH